jgi:uncharacterized membrane protein YfcA
VSIDLPLALGGLISGFAVGLTGMGGGALMTPMLVLLFRVQPLAAVSSDLLTSFFMKPVGGVIHLRRGTVRRDIAIWLSIASVPSALLGVIAIRLAGTDELDHLLRYAIGASLLASAGSMVLKARIDSVRGLARPEESPAVRRSATLLVGALGGFMVGLTSVGSGSLIIALLLILYPGLLSSHLVGTDIVQAVPLVGSAALGHLIFGDVKFALTASLLVGAIPGVFAGALLSSRTRPVIVRPALFVFLAASGLKLVQAF